MLPIACKLHVGTNTLCWLRRSLQHYAPSDSLYHKMQWLHWPLKTRKCVDQDFMQSVVANRVGTASTTKHLISWQHSKCIDFALLLHCWWNTSRKLSVLIVLLWAVHFRFLLLRPYTFPASCSFVHQKKLRKAIQVVKRYTITRVWQKLTEPMF